MTAPIVSIDGVLCDPSTASISIFDSGFLHGDGVFTVLRGRGGAAVDLVGHLEQLAADAAQLELATPPLPQLTAAVGEVLAAFGAGAARLRLVLTRGRGGLAVRWRDHRGGRLLLIAEPPGPPRAEVRAAVVAEPRLAHATTWAAKSLSYQPALWARQRAAALGAEEAVRLFSDDTVGEGAASNLFLVRGGALITPPPLGIRPGVTRRRVLALGAAAHLVCQERPVALAELTSADELFVTSSIAGVVPVVALDGQARPRGPVTELLREAYERFALSAP